MQELSTDTQHNISLAPSLESLHLSERAHFVRGGNDLKYTLEGFDQTAALKMQKTDEAGNIIKLDAIDLVILRWFVDFYPGMAKRMIGNKEYGWVKYDAVVDDLPLLDMKKQSITKRFVKYVELGVLEHITVKEKGTFSYYTFGAKYMELVSNNPAGGLYPDIEGSISRYRGGLYPDIEGSIPGYRTNNPSTKYPSTKDNPKEREGKTSSRFTPPTLDEVKAYCLERGNNVDAQRFVDYYSSIGWVVGKARTPMKDWRASVRTWEKSEKQYSSSPASKQEPELLEEEKQRRAANLEDFRRNKIIG